MRTSKNTYGDGAIIRRPWSPFWYICYYVGGRQIRESSKSTKKQVAKALLRKRMGEAAAGLEPVQDVKEIRYEGVRAALLEEYRMAGHHSLKRRANGELTLDSLPHLDRYFSGWSVASIDTTAIRQFALSRQTDGAANATINRILAPLRRPPGSAGVAVEV